MKALNIYDLFLALGKEIQKGHGDYTIFVTDDEEANGYHALWFKGDTATDMEDEVREFVEEINHDLSILEDKYKAYYLG